MSKRTSGTFRDYLRSRSTDPSNVGHVHASIAHPLMRRLSDVSAHRKHTSAGVAQPLPPAGHPHGVQSVQSVRRAKSLHESTTSGDRSSMRPYSTFINDVHGLRSASRPAADALPSSVRLADDQRTTNIVEETEAEQEPDVDVTAADDDRDEAAPMAPVVCGFESTDDWYASVSDMEDSDNAPSKPYAYNAVNPVLECVNQVSDCCSRTAQPPFHAHSH